jgi:hypothetical protein
MGVPAKRVDELDVPDCPAGAFEYYSQGDREIAGMMYRCPCGCGVLGSLAFRPAPSPSWQWDGNTEVPTLSPSVHHVGHWHGFLTKGVWETC